MIILTGVCGSIIEKNIDDILKTLNKALELDVDYIELRLDVVENITSPMANYIIKSIKQTTATPIILTNRAKDEGGYFTGSQEDRIAILKDNAPLVEYTDIELNTDSLLQKEVIDNANKTIISYHNFNKTPSYDVLQEIVDKAGSIGDIPKVAVKPLTMEDTHSILKLLIENKNIIAISMDKLGSYTRVIGPILGSPITYASIGPSSAPGQLDVETTSWLIKKLKY